MAFILRFKSPSAVFTLDELSPTTTVKSLKIQLEGMTSIPVQKMKVIHGYPPKTLPSDDSTLSDLGIKSGDSLMIDILPENMQGAGNETTKSTAQVEVHQSSSKSASIPDADHGTMIKKSIKANNSCLFSSLYFLLIDSSDVDYVECEVLRETCAKAVAGDPTKYNTAILSKPNHEYCEFIRNRNNWGGYIELGILSEHFNVEIVVINAVNAKPHRIGEAKNYANRVFLIYDGIHYEPLFLQFKDSIQTQFRTDDEHPLDLALSIAIEAKARRQYTDVANFKLKCLICDQLLTGERQATEHCRLTNHDSYGEVS